MKFLGGLHSCRILLRYTGSSLSWCSTHKCSQYAAADSLDESYCPWLRGKPRPSSSVGAGAMTSAMTSGGGEAREHRLHCYYCTVLPCSPRCNRNKVSKLDTC